MTSAGYSLRMLGEADTYDRAALQRADEAITRSGSARARAFSELHNTSGPTTGSNRGRGSPTNGPHAFTFDPPSRRASPSPPPPVAEDREVASDIPLTSDANASPDAIVEEGNPFEGPTGAVHGPAAAGEDAVHFGASGDASDDSDLSDFDWTEDIFEPIQQIRLRRQRLKMTLSKQCAAQAITNSVPALHWLPRYVPARDLLADLIAGCMLSVISVPQAMAYALLAGISPIYGLYSCLISPLLYAFLGCSRTMHVGPVAVLCLLLGNAINDVTPIGANTAYKQDAAILLSILVGVLLLATSFLRLGFAVSFLSDSVLSAYNCASAFLIFTSQLGSFVGIKVPAGLGFVETFVHLFEHLDEINGAAVLLGFGTVGLILGIDALNAKYKPRYPLPTQLVAVVLGIILSYAGGLKERYGLAVIGIIPKGLPMPRFPGASPSDYATMLPDGTVDTSAAPLTLLNFAQIKALMQPAAMIALVSYVISISIAKDFAMRDNDKRQKVIKEQQSAVALSAVGDHSAPGSTVAGTVVVEAEVVIDANQELFALGIANLFGGFFQSFPTGGALSRTVLVYNSGVRTPLAIAFSVGLFVIILCAMTPLLAPLPFTVLAAIVFTALRTLLLQVREGKRLLHLRRQDFLMWCFTFSCTLLFDTQTGIAAGLVTSLLMLLKQTSRPPSSTLGRLPETDVYRDVRQHPLSQCFRGVLIFRWNAPLHFANAAFFKQQLEKHMRRAALRDYRQHRSPDQQAADQAAADARLAADGLHIPQRLRRGWDRTVGTVGTLVHQFGSRIRPSFRRLRRTASVVQVPEDPEVDLHATHIHEWANMSEETIAQHDQRMRDSQHSGMAGISSSHAHAISPLPARPQKEVTLEDCRIRYVVLDCSAITDIDDTALKMLLALGGQLAIQLAFAQVQSSVRDLLERVHLFDAAALAAIETDHAGTSATGTAPAPNDGTHRLNVPSESADAPTLEADLNELGLARPWASIHQVVQFIVQHMRDMQQKQASTLHQQLHETSLASPPSPRPADTTYAEETTPATT